MNQLCAYCDHPLSAHCKGQQSHFHSKGQTSVVVTCVSRHCDNPLCCCVDFVAPKGKAL